MKDNTAKAPEGFLVEACGYMIVYMSLLFAYTRTHTLRLMGLRFKRFPEVSRSLTLHVKPSPG